MRWTIETDRNPELLSRYHDMFKLPLYINDVPMDVYRQQKSIFNWFLNDFEDVDDYRTLITMRNIINFPLITMEEKESHLELYDMSDDIMTAEKSPFK